MAYISVNSSSVSLGSSITVNVYGLVSGTSYFLDTEYSDGTYGSGLSWRASSSSRTWSFTPTKTGYVTIILYSGYSNDFEDSVDVYVSSSGGGEEEEEGCIEYDGMELVSSSYANGVVTVRFRIYYYNYGDTRDSATIYYQIGGNGYFSQSVSASGWSDGYITCNMTIATGTLTGTSYLFNVNGYIDSNNCGNDHFSQNLNATWTKVRPSKFYWISSSSNLKSGTEISSYITASKWKSLQDNVNAVRTYKDLSNYSFTTYSSGQTITATAYNQIANAINGIKSGTVSTVSKGQQITASVMMALQNGINSIT